jgi:hypothetical protein
MNEELVKRLQREIGFYGAQCSETKELSPHNKLVAVLGEVFAALTAQQEPQVTQEVVAWRTVDGRLFDREDTAEHHADGVTKARPLIYGDTTPPSAQQEPVAKKPCPACGGPLVECQHCEGEGYEPGTDNDVTGPALCSECGGLGGKRNTTPPPAQQEPVKPIGRLVIHADETGSDMGLRFFENHGCRPGDFLYKSPPSGVREGLLRAAEIANAMPIYSAHDIADAIVREANLRRDAQIAKAQIDIEALRAEAERVEQTHVMVPVDLLQKIDRTAEAGLCAGTFGGCREFLKDIRAMVCSAQEGKK